MVTNKKRLQLSWHSELKKKKLTRPLKELNENDTRQFNQKEKSNACNVLSDDQKNNDQLVHREVSLNMICFIKSIWLLFPKKKLNRVFTRSSF